MIRPRIAALVAIAFTLFSFGGSAFSLPSVGAPLPAIAVRDAWDRTLDLQHLGAMPILVVYEDRASSGENQPLKNELARLARGGQYRGKVALVPVADVASYDFWPVRGFVVRAIKDESHKIGAPIYCDWDEHVLRALGLQKGKSNVVLFGKDGRVLLSQVGPMPPEVRSQLIAMLREIVGP